MQMRDDRIYQVSDPGSKMGMNNFKNLSEENLLDEIYTHFKELLALQETKTASEGTLQDSVHEIIVNHLIDMILVLDSDFTIRYANQAIQESLQYLPSGLRGKNLFHLLHPGDAEKIREPLAGIWSHPQRKFMLKHVRLRRKGGAWSAFEAVGKVVSQNAANPLLLLSFRSIQEETVGSAREQIPQESSRMEASLLRMTADYDKQLAIIRKVIEWLEEERLSNSQRYYLHMIAAAVDRSESWIRRFRSYINPPEPKQRTIRVGLLLKDFQETIAPLLPANYRITVQDLPSNVQVIGDPGQIQQVLSILCSNALEAMPEGGAIMLGASHDIASGKSSVDANGRQRYVQIFVRDTGHGIDAEVRPHLFEPYITTKTPKNGRGLGLAIARRLLEQQDGWINVQSEEPSGTTVIFGLPQDPGDRKSSPESRTTGGEKESTILGKEDETSLRRLIQSVVRKQSEK